MRMPFRGGATTLTIALSRTAILLLVVTATQAAAQASQGSEQQARAAMEAGRFNEAYAALRPALEAEPERADLWFLAGQIVAAMGQPERALQAFDSSITLSPDIPSPWFGRGLALLTLERFEEAATSLERCLELAPGTAAVAPHLGLARLRAGDPTGALEALSAADPTSAEYGEAVRYRVEALRTLGRGSEAINAANAYLATDLDYQPVRFELALALGEAGRASDAVIAMRAAAVANPPFPAAVLEYARALRGTDIEDDHIEAAGLYRHSLDYFPDDGAMLGELASLYLELGLEAEAADEAMRIVSVAGNDPDALLIAGNVLLQARRPQNALAALDAAVAGGPTNPWIYHHQGLALVELQRFDEALDAFRAALVRDALMLETRVQGARAALFLARPEVAIDLLDAAGPMAQGNAAALAMLGEAYVEARRFEEAIAPLRRSLQLDPDLPDAPYLLARAYRGTGEEDLANEALAEFQVRADQRSEAQAADGDAAAYQRQLTQTRAAVLVAENRFDEAAPILDAAIAEDATNPDLYELMATVQESFGNVERATELRQRAAELRR